MELRDYWSTVRRRWRLITAVLLLVVSASAALTYQTTPLYQSSAQLFISTQPSNTSDLVQGGNFATQRVSSYADLVGTGDLSVAVAEDLGGNMRPATLRGKVRAQVVPETVSLEIIATDPDPLVARDIADAYATAIRDKVSELETPPGEVDPLVTASVVDSPVVSTSPVSPNPVRNIGLGVVLGLLLGVGLAVARDLLDTSVTSPEEVAGVSGVPMLGNLATDPRAVKELPSDVLSRPTPWAEALRVLRTNLQFVQVDTQHRVFVVSSSLPGEGKSTVATNLAVTLALGGEKVALVDCDLRRPTVADRLGLDDAVGTTDVLIGRIAVDEALQDYADTGLQVLTSGPIPPNPSELMQSQAMEALLTSLGKRFSIVILDAPPLLPVTDAALLATHTDGLLAVVRHGRTTRDQLGHAMERLEAVSARCIGTVLNQTPSKKGRQGYGYGYGYGPLEGRITQAEAGGKRAARRAAAKQSETTPSELDESSDSRPGSPERVRNR